MSKTLLLVILISICYSCKKHRRIDVEGIVTDGYNGLPVSNLKVKLISVIKAQGTLVTESKEYETYTDVNGKYSFKDAYFSNPEFTGYVEADYENYVMTDHAGEIVKHQAKLIGHTRLIRNFQVYCYSKLNLTVNVNSAYQNWESLQFEMKFIGSKNLGSGNFTYNGVYHYSGSNGSPNKVYGYSDGKTVYQLKLKKSDGTIMTTQYDTVVSPACGSSISHTITIN